MKNGYADSQEISIHKRTKYMTPFHQERNFGAYRNEMDEQGISPLGLKLRKSPSLLHLIHLSMCGKKGDTLQDVGEAVRSNNIIQEKKKASNFSALVVRIGAWEYVSRHEGDLVAKCYFSKRKLVWEVLEGGLKSKIEIQWPDINGLNATIPKNEVASLEIELSRPPMFFRESNPQPRKHTIWQATSDFTGGEATLYKRHLLLFPKGQLDRHYQSLMESDPRLKMLSKNGLPSTDSPYFDTRFAPFRDQHELYLRMLQQSICHSVLPQNSDCYLPPLTNLPEAKQKDYISDVEQIEAQESFSGFSESRSEDTSSWSSKGKMKLDELAHYLLDDALLTSNHRDKPSLDTINSNLRSFYQLQERMD
ncbi:hypothetical protein KI387_031960 [Taxus chinensis]|uniref:TRF2/HOY1 PH-like domain-containing protein n=1 Tax=Taxus chinensis TaxID=29808 RepID=A0AA38F346_TAXCH|nr:hypothetical protein KI387_031960 [Taxus chinensis]